MYHVHCTLDDHNKPLMTKHDDPAGSSKSQTKHNSCSNKIFWCGFSRSHPSALGVRPTFSEGRNNWEGPGIPSFSDWPRNLTRFVCFFPQLLVPVCQPGKPNKPRQVSRPIGEGRNNWEGPGIPSFSDGQVSLPRNLMLFAPRQSAVAGI